MGVIDKNVLMRFLNKIPDGYELEYNNLDFDKAVLMYSTDSKKAYLFSKNYRSSQLTSYITDLLKETNSVDNIYAYHLSKNRVSSFDWKNASKEVQYIINQFESSEKLPETSSIYGTVYTILKNDRLNNENSQFKNVEPRFISRLIASKFNFSDIRNIYQCQRKTVRTLDKIMTNLQQDLIMNGHEHMELKTNSEELELIRNCLQPYFRLPKSASEEIVEEQDIINGDLALDELPTQNVVFDDKADKNIEMNSKAKPRKIVNNDKTNEIEKA